MFSLEFQVSWELKLPITGDLDNDFVVAFSFYWKVPAEQPVGGDGLAHGKCGKQDMKGEVAFV